MTKEAITARAGQVMALVAAIVTIFASWFDRFDTPLEKVLLTLGTSLGYFGIFAAARWVLLRVKYRKLLGLWYYRTRAHGDIRFKDHNVALMEFYLDGADIRYRVWLFPDADSLEKAMVGQRRPTGGGQRGCAESRALEYDVAKGRVDLVFDVTYSGDRIQNMDRVGILTLQLQRDGTMHGEYASQILEYGEGKPARALSSGVMFATPDLDDLKALLSADDPHAGAFERRQQQGAGNAGSLIPTAS